MGVRSMARLILRLFATLPGIALVLAAACWARLVRPRRIRRPHVVLGATPIITLSLIAKSLRAAGYRATTLVNTPYSINHSSDFDSLIAGLAPAGALHRFGLSPLARAIEPYIAETWLLLHADVLVCFFDGGPLADAIVAPWEPALLRLAGCRSVVMPYGSDVFIASQIACTPWRDGIVATYPHLKRNEIRIAARIRRWCAGADRVIGCIVHRETLPRWDVLTTHYYPIDTDCWTVAAHHPERDGRSAEVIIGHAPNHRGVKGTEFLLASMDRLRARGVLVRLELLERIPNEQVRERLARCDILVEQLHLGYGLNAIEGMALGRPVISNLSDDRYYALHRQLTGLDDCPIVSCGPDGLDQALISLISDPTLRQRLGAAGRTYVERFHSLAAMSRFWDLLLRSLCGNGSLKRNHLQVWHPDHGYPDDRSW